jgi:hypothetical protein
LRSILSSYWVFRCTLMFTKSVGLQHCGIGYFVALRKTCYFKNIWYASAFLEIGEAAAPDLVALVRSPLCGLTCEPFDAATGKVTLLAAFSEAASGVRHLYCCRRDKFDGEGLPHKGSP